MNHKIITLSALLFASSNVLAETSLLEAAGKQLIKDKSTAVAPGAVEKVESAGQAVDNAKAAKSAVETAPEVVTDQATETVKSAAEEKAKAAVPAEATQAVDTVKSGKAVMDAAPKSSGEAAEAVKNKASQKATEKAFDLLR
jgi:hypothetical protein